jgi:hypothetical protein
MSAKPKCEACDHSDRDQLDVQLARGVGISVVAEAFALPITTVVWHVERHLTGVPKKTSTDPRDLLDDLQYVKTRAENVLQMALESDKPTVALTAIREFRETVMSLAKLTHAEEALDPRAFIPFWNEVKGRIMALAEEHPELRDEMVQALSIEDMRGTKK